MLIPRPASLEERDGEFLLDAGTRIGAPASLSGVGIEHRHPDGPRPWQRRPGIPGRPATHEQREEHIQEMTATSAG